MLKLRLSWSKPSRLRDGSHDGLVYKVDDKVLPEDPGIYVFARTHGQSFEALYVGKATSLRGRVRSQLANNVKLVRHLEKANAGHRVVVCGALRLKPGQKLKKALGVAEGAFIRYYLAQGHDLVNEQGMKIRRHEVLSSRPDLKKHLPRSLYVEKLSKTAV